MVSRQTSSGLPVFGKSYYVIDYDTEQRRMSKIRDSKMSLSQRISDMGKQGVTSVVDDKSNASFGMHPASEESISMHQPFSKGRVTRTEEGVFRKQTIPEDNVSHPQFVQPKKSTAKALAVPMTPPTVQDDGLQRHSKHSSFQNGPRVPGMGRLDIPSPPKKKLTPINSDSKPLTSPTNPRPFYHDVCKRVSPDASLSKSPKKKSPSKSPKGQNFYDKHPEFWVKQYRKIESMRPEGTSVGGGNQRSVSPRVSPMNATAPIRSTNNPISWTGGHTQPVSQTQRMVPSNPRPTTTPSCHCPQTQQLPNLPDNQFCRFCDDYMHPVCFDRFVNRN